MSKYDPIEWAVLLGAIGPMLAGMAGIVVSAIYGDDKNEVVVDIIMTLFVPLLVIGMSMLAMVLISLPVVRLYAMRSRSLYSDTAFYTDKLWRRMDTRMIPVFRSVVEKLYRMPTGGSRPDDTRWSLRAFGGEPTAMDLLAHCAVALGLDCELCSEDTQALARRVGSSKKRLIDLAEAVEAVLRTATDREAHLSADA